MGFTTAFIGGITLTTTVAYLSLAHHRQTRYQQALLLRQQRAVLDSLLLPVSSPPPPPPPPPPALSSLSQSSSASSSPSLPASSSTAAAAAAALPVPLAPAGFLSGLVETSKDLWNAELRGVVRRVQSIDWLRVENSVEAALVGAWARLSHDNSDNNGGSGSDKAD